MMSDMHGLIQIAERIETIGLSRAQSFVSENHHISGRPGDIAIAADCFTVAAALRAQASRLAPKGDKR
jgi:hypothetical protein